MTKMTAYKKMKNCLVAPALSQNVLNYIVNVLHKELFVKNNASAKNVIIIIISLKLGKKS